MTKKKEIELTEQDFNNIVVMFRLARKSIVNAGIQDEEEQVAESLNLQVKVAELLKPLVKKEDA